MDRRRNVFRFLSIVFALVFILSTVHCTRCSKKERDIREVSPVTKPKRSPEPVIVEVKLDPPEPTSVDYIQARPVLEDSTLTHVKYNFRWYVGGELVPGYDKSLLDKKHTKKGDKVYCRVSAKRGKHESRPINSKRIEIKNAPPVLNLSSVAPFKIPGPFTYTIAASDPDGDTLTYRLVEPLGLGIVINPGTGDLTWNILEIPTDEPPAPSPGTGSESEESGETVKRKPSPKQQPAEPRLTSIVRIVFEVTDADGAAARGFIDLNLSKQGEAKEIPE
jgi:hypothetical protein